jgi:endonuclease/exonuclease/phosphatase family metal-dependent hydrolase
MRWTRRRVTIASAIGAVVLLLAAAGAFLLWASAGRQSPGTFDGPVHDYGAGTDESAEPGSSLVVMTWNIAYAHGPGSEGTGYSILPEDEAAARLARIGNVIRDSGADVALLQEVDFDSDRSHRVDQLEALARYTGLRYAARAVTWRARYVPFPYWPPSGHWGRMESGGAVLSRYPVKTNSVTLHPKPDAYSLIHNAFYLFRYSQVVTIRRGGRELRVVNSHLDAYDRPNREEQAKALAIGVRDLVSSGGVDVLGGDMNAPPPEAALLHAFPDEPGTDFRGDATMATLRGIDCGRLSTRLRAGTGRTASRSRRGRRTAVWTTSSRARGSR